MARTWAWRSSPLALACACALLLAAHCVAAQSSPSGLYARPPSRPPLGESHPRLARSPDANSHAPEQVHLAFAGPGAYAVTWVTYPLDSSLDAAAAGAQPQAAPASRRLAAAASAVAQQEQQLGRRRRHDLCAPVVGAAGRSMVQYGSSPGDYSHTVEGADAPACYQSGSYVSGAIHRAVMGAGSEGPLPPNATVYYRVGDPGRGWSDEFSFSTAPLPGSPGALPYRLGVLGDLGQSDHSLSTLEHLLVSAPHSVILTGDLSYADGYQPRWDTWQRLVAPHTSRQVWMYCVGNHEIELTGGVKDFLAYETRFYCPWRHSLSPSPLFYSFDVAAAHVVMLSSYSPYSAASEQYEWLVRDLAALDRGRTPWLIVVQHAPWYNSNYAHQGEGDAMKAAMESLLYQHGVDFVFAGHVHAYERHHRVFADRLDPCAPIHINIGDGGNKEGPDKKYYAQPAYSAFREPSFGHGTLDLTDETHAEWRWHRNQDDGPESADSVSVVRDPNCKPLRAARLEAWRRQREAQQQQQQRQQQQPAAAAAVEEEEAGQQAALLEQEAARRAATAALRERLSSEEAAEQQQQPEGSWCRLCGWLRRLRGWLLL